MTLRASFFLLPVLMVACQPPQSAAPPGSAAEELLFAVPAFSFTERSGKTVGNADLKGKVWIASFVFTRCIRGCPQVSTTIARLQEEYKTEPDIRFVTFTIDPDRDKLADLKKYADQYRADPDRWLFLTGGENEIHNLSVEGFKLAVNRRADPKPGDEFEHTPKIAVVDRNGFIRGYFDGMAPDRPGGKEELEESLAKLKALVARLQKK